MRRVTELRLRSGAPSVSTDFLARRLPAVGDPGQLGFGKVTFTNSQSPSAGSAGGGLDPFWKFSVFTDDIVACRSQLVRSGRSVSEPVQFGDIGYLCHLEEPGGNAVELLQRTFKDHPSVQAGQPDTLGLITLRITDIAASRRFYEQGLGMRLLSTMAIDDGRPDPFDLYFFGWVDEPLPDGNVAAVANREWLYQRSCTLIELQHYRSLPAALGSGSTSAGLEHVAIEATDLASLTRDLAATGTTMAESPDRITFASPDGHPFIAER